MLHVIVLATVGYETCDVESWRLWAQCGCVHMHVWCVYGVLPVIVGSCCWFLDGGVTRLGLSAEVQAGCYASAKCYSDAQLQSTE
jgi:hypothetical protein